MTKALTNAQNPDFINTLGDITSTLNTSISSNVGAINVGILSYIDSNVLASFSSNVNNFNQVVIQNTNYGSSASSDLVLTNNLSNATAYYGDLGINSSTYSGLGSLNLPNAVYLTATTGDLVLGTTTANAIHFVSNNKSTDSITISNTGTVTIPNLNFTTNGSSTTITVQNKLQQEISVIDFGASTGASGIANTAAFNAAWAAANPMAVLIPAGTYAISGTVTGTFYSFGAVTITGGTVTSITSLPGASGNIQANITPSNEATQLTLAQATQPVIGQGRAKIQYYDATDVYVYCPPQIVMGGFRFNGQYKKGRAPLVNTGVNGKTIVSTVSNLGCETATIKQNWYAVFACSNSGDATVTFKVMPFLRVGSVAGSVCTLNYAGYGANAHSIVAATYNFTATNNLAGVDCLVISEIQSALNYFSGRTTTITANTTTSVTLATIGTVGAYDFLLPAPPGYTNYCYLGAFLLDAGGSNGTVMNIADTGTIVGSLVVVTADPNWSATGALTNVQLHWGGYISPLAMGITVDDSCSLSTASLGSFTTNHYHDGSSHLIAQFACYKEVNGSYSYGTTFLLPFSQGQITNYSSTGTLSATRVSGSLNVLGWIEP